MSVGGAAVPGVRCVNGCACGVSHFKRRVGAAECGAVSRAVGMVGVGSRYMTGVLLFGVYTGKVIGMAITTSAKKAIRSSRRRRVFNLRRLRSMRSSIKRTVDAYRGGDGAGAREQFRLAQKAIDKAAKRGIITERTASRRKSVLARSIKPGVSS